MLVFGFCSVCFYNHAYVNSGSQNRPLLLVALFCVSRCQHMIRKLLSEADSQALPKRQRLSWKPDDGTELHSIMEAHALQKLQRLSWMPDDETELRAIMNARNPFAPAPAEPPLQVRNIKRVVPPLIINALLVPLDIFLRTSAASLADQSTAAQASTAFPADQHEEVDAASVGSGSRKRAHEDASEASVAVGSEVPRSRQNAEASYLQNAEASYLQWLSCEYKCKCASDLKRHRADVHDINVRWHACDMCEYKSKRAVHLKQHRAKRHRAIVHATLEQHDLFLIDEENPIEHDLDLIGDSLGEPHGPCSINFPHR